MTNQHCTHPETLLASHLSRIRKDIPSAPPTHQQVLEVFVSPNQLASRET